MGIPDLEAKDFEELWRLHEELTRILAEKIMAEKLELERRLALLRRNNIVGETSSAQGATTTEAAPTRKYPRVRPKYRNPAPPGETWSGRGKQPRWLVKALESGHKLEEFRIGEKDQNQNENKARGRGAS